ncbi:hypothetical protein CHARACLAT_017881 [Characodon lateralis]|uniref:Uncharacterized protein n=1 Tax=Characodon lateralis TaxID=208331 RepID=A0ABU7DS07_9TELE|nr:hypothetical protein [Characodon lateralis]
MRDTFENKEGNTVTYWEGGEVILVMPGWSRGWVRLPGPDGVCGLCLLVPWMMGLAGMVGAPCSPSFGVVLGPCPRVVGSCWLAYGSQGCVRPTGGFMCLVSLSTVLAT